MSYETHLPCCDQDGLARYSFDGPPLPGSPGRPHRLGAGHNPSRPSAGEGADAKTFTGQGPGRRAGSSGFATGVTGRVGAPLSRVAVGSGGGGRLRADPEVGHAQPSPPRHGQPAFLSPATVAGGRSGTTGHPGRRPNHRSDPHADGSRFGQRPRPGGPGNPDLRP